MFSDARVNDLGLAHDTCNLANPVRGYCEEVVAMSRVGVAIAGPTIIPPRKTQLYPERFTKKAKEVS